MDKRCSKCGSEMDVTLRTVYFNNTKFKNVPVYTCTYCDHNELVDHAKAEIKRLVIDRTKGMKKEEIQFDQHCELAQLLVIAYHNQELPHIDETLFTEIEDLLDQALFENTPEEYNYLRQKVHKKLDKILH